ncbi:MAG: T9SS type A sorting domain-containing protein [Flavobacteriales bacterium]
MIENNDIFIGEFTKQVDLSEYPKGIYMVQIRTNNSFITKRIVVQ